MCTNILTHLCVDRKRKNEIINQNNNRVQQKILCCDFFLSLFSFLLLSCVCSFLFVSLLVVVGITSSLCSTVHAGNFTTWLIFGNISISSSSSFFLHSNGCEQYYIIRFFEVESKRKIFLNRNLFRSVDCGRCVDGGLRFSTEFIQSIRVYKIENEWKFMLKCKWAPLKDRDGK